MFSWRNKKNISTFQFEKKNASPGTMARKGVTNGWVVSVQALAISSSETINYG